MARPDQRTPRTWLLRHDPGLAVVRRAARVTLVACVAFYLCRYALDNVTMAPYALFGVVAMGALSQIPGRPAERSRTLLAVLPVGWVLVTLGTLLSVTTATAVAGMFVLGFAVAYRVMRNRKVGTRDTASMTRTAEADMSKVFA